jgi:hypothetical protein
MPKKTIFSREEINHIILLRNEGVSLKEIGSKFKKSKEVIRRVLGGRMGLFLILNTKEFMNFIRS